MYWGYELKPIMKYSNSFIAKALSLSQMNVYSKLRKKNSHACVCLSVHDNSGFFYDLSPFTFVTIVLINGKAQH